MRNIRKKTENGVMLQAFEWELPADAGHWKRLAGMSRTLAFQGVTAVWLPPAAKGNAGIHDTGYGVYDLWDLGEFDQKGSVSTKYGTRAEFQEAVRQIRRYGMQALCDLVLNHRMGGEEEETVRAVPVDTENRLHTLGAPEEIRAYTHFTFPGRRGKYSEFVWNASCFTGVDYSSTDPDHHLFLFEGKQWAEDVDREKGNYDYLMGCDVDVNAPWVREELLNWGRWFLKTSGCDGFRLDAVKHISAGFYRDFLSRLRQETGRELYSVGEYWNSDVHVLHNYLEQTGYAMNLFDVPLHFHFLQASSTGGGYDMRHILDDTLVSTHAQNAVTFVDNHDTQPGQSLESWVQGWFKASAYGLILLRKEGYPCVFWGDLKGIPSSGIGKVPELPILMKVRQKLAYGYERDYLDDPNVIGFVREGDDRVPGSGLVFLCTNGAGGQKEMEVGKKFAGRTFVCLIGDQKRVKIDEQGKAVFSVKDGRMSLYVPVQTPREMLGHGLRTAGRFLSVWLRRI